MGDREPPSIAMFAQDAFVRPSGIARYQTELVSRFAGRMNLHLLIVHPSHVKASHGSLPGPLQRATLEHYTNPSTVLSNSRRILAGFIEHPDLFDWHPRVFLEVISTRLFTGAYIDRAAFDLVHGTASYLPLTTGKTARVVTIHDTTPLTMPERHMRNTVKCFVRPSEIRPEDQVIADSRSGLVEILNVVDHPRENTHVIYLGIDRDVFFPRREQPGGGDYLLTVGTIEPRKNLVRALAAFEKVANDHPGLQWKIAGSRGWGWADFSAALARSPARHRVELMGPVTDTELGDLYRGSRAVLFPTLWEGFGFPVAEALACGVPVAASKLPATQEVGGHAFVPLDPESVDSIAEAIVRAAFDEQGRAARRAAGLEHTRQFDWSAAAGSTLGVYARALERSPEDLLLPAPTP
jgi:glycosyltransferase involved in cell wall biosynthesis